MESAIAPNLLSTPALAYLGDAVVELCVRSYLVKKGICHSKDLNREALSFVPAGKQADAAERILPLLTEEEHLVYRRAHNVSHLQHVPKGATVQEYRSATGLEALFGYLFADQNYDRIGELFCLGYEIKE